jgi:hypothetical protein
MRPPICYLCDLDFRDSDSEGGLVQFKLTESDKESNKRLLDSRMTGHPSGSEWFCQEHLEQAQRYKHLTLKQALRLMRTS